MEGEIESGHGAAKRLAAGAVVLVTLIGFFYWYGSRVPSAPPALECCKDPKPVVFEGPAVDIKGVLRYTTPIFAVVPSGSTADTPYFLVTRVEEFNLENFLLPRVKTEVEIVGVEDADGLAVLLEKDEVKKTISKLELSPTVVRGVKLLWFNGSTLAIQKEPDPVSGQSVSFGSAPRGFSLRNISDSELALTFQNYFRFASRFALNCLGKQIGEGRVSELSRLADSVLREEIAELFTCLEVQPTYRQLYDLYSSEQKTCVSKAVSSSRLEEILNGVAITETEEPALTPCNEL